MEGVKFLTIAFLHSVLFFVYPLIYRPSVYFIKNADNLFHDILALHENEGRTQGMLELTYLMEYTMPKTFVNSHLK